MTTATMMSKDDNDNSDVEGQAVGNVDGDDTVDGEVDGGVDSSVGGAYCNLVRVRSSTLCKM